MTLVQQPVHRLQKLPGGKEMGEPTGTPTWQGAQNTVLLDLSRYSPWRIEYAGGLHDVS